MKQAITAFALSFGLCAAPAFADQLQQPPKSPQAVKMSDAQLDNVVAGQLSIAEGLINVNGVSVDVRLLNNSANNNTVQVPVAANVSAAVALLGNAAAMATQFGRQLTTP
jgi:hypothetical protein